MYSNYFCFKENQPRIYYVISEFSFTEDLVILLGEEGIPDEIVKNFAIEGISRKQHCKDLGFYKADEKHLCGSRRQFNQVVKLNAEKTAALEQSNEDADSGQ